MLTPFALKTYTFIGKIYTLTEVAFSVKQYLIMPGSAILLEETLFNNDKTKINIELRYVKSQTYLQRFMRLPTKPSRQVDTFRWMNPYLNLLLIEETSCRQLKLHCECGYEWSTFEHHTQVQGISHSRGARESLACHSRDTRESLASHSRVARESLASVC